MKPTASSLELVATVFELAPVTDDFTSVRNVIVFARFDSRRYPILCKLAYRLL
jgi:hypothetical protein